MTIENQYLRVQFDVATGRLVCFTINLFIIYFPFFGRRQYKTRRPISCCKSIRNWYGTTLAMATTTSLAKHPVSNFSLRVSPLKSPNPYHSLLYRCLHFQTQQDRDLQPHARQQGLPLPRQRLLRAGSQTVMEFLGIPDCPPLRRCSFPRNGTHRRSHRYF